MTNRGKKKLQQIKKELNQLSIKATWLNTCSKEEQLQWFIDVCQTFKSNPRPQKDHISDIKNHFKERVDILKLYQTNDSLASEKELYWLASMEDRKMVNEENRLKGIFGGGRDWYKFENKTESKGRKLQSPAAQDKRKTNQQKLQGYWDKKYNQAQTLEKLYPHQKDICKVLNSNYNSSTKNSKGNTNKTGKKEYSFDINKTEKWFNELRKKDGYKRTGDKPHIGKITQEIIKRHHKDKDSDGKPSEDTIGYHRRKLGLMQYNFKD